MLVDDTSSRLIPDSPPLADVPADEDRVLRELFRAGGELPSDAEGEVPSLRRNLALTMSADNLYCCLTCLRQTGYVETTLIAQTDQWLRHYRPLQVRLTDAGRRYVLATPPVKSGWTAILIYIALSGTLIALLQDLIGDTAYGIVGIGMLAAAVIALLLRRAGQLYFGKQPHA